MEKTTVKPCPKCKARRYLRIRFSGEGINYVGPAAIVNFMEVKKMSLALCVNCGIVFSPEVAKEVKVIKKKGGKKK